MLSITPLKSLQKMKQKAANDLNALIQKSVSLLLQDKQREKYTLTDIYDVKKELNFKLIEEQPIALPMIDACFQIQPSVKSF